MRHLGLATATTSYSDAAKGEVTVTFEDWTVDGTPLRSLLGWARPPQDMTPLCAEAWWPRAAVKYLRRLGGSDPGDFADGRVSLLVCPIDGDLGCGALSMRLTMDDEAVTWTDLGWQNNYEPFDTAERLPDLEFQFGRDSYDRLLGGTLARYTDLAALKRE